VFAVCATLLVLGMPLTAGADPGDPRLVSGVLEWPVVATSTPFVIIRGDNGVLYYVSVAAARRAGAVKAGARVSVLGIEGPTAHEIRAVGMGSGPTAEAALADLQAAPAPPGGCTSSRWGHTSCCRGSAGRARTGGRRSGARGGHTANRRAVARSDHIANRLHNPRGNDARSVGGADAWRPHRRVR
jgi:hypothetical protein